MKLLTPPLMVALLMLSSTNLAAAKSPILLINGILGAQLDVRDERRWFSIFNHKCNTEFGGDFNTLWVDFIQLPKCGEYELSMQYDPATGRFSDMPGVTIRVPDFGGTSSVEFLGFVPYFWKFVDYFVDRGYERGKSIRAAPYDWRLAADELKIRGYFGKVKTLVQNMYKENGNEKVTLVVHSMGGLVSHHFLTGYSGINQAWKDKYINAWVPLSGAWSGGVQAAAAAISGKQFGAIPNEFLATLLSSALSGFLVSIARSIESLPWLLPRATVFKDMILVSTPSRNYTAADYKQLFERLGYTNGYEIHQNLLHTLNVDFAAPNVDTYCYYGVDVPTPERFIYDRELDDTIFQPTLTIDGNGDGTVNLVSSKVCHRWASMRPRHQFQVREYKEVSHVAIVSEARVLGDIALIVRASPPKSTVSRA